MLVGEWEVGKLMVEVVSGINTRNAPRATRGKKLEARGWRNDANLIYS